MLNVIGKWFTRQKQVDVFENVKIAILKEGGVSITLDNGNTYVSSSEHGYVWHNTSDFNRVNIDLENKLCNAFTREQLKSKYNKR